MRIINARVLTPDEEMPLATVSIADGVIADVSAQDANALAGSPDDVDARGSVLLPGFIDLHNHGALGADAMDCDAEAWQAQRRFLATHGVTSYLATTTAAPRETLDNVLGFATTQMTESPSEDAAAELLGVHLEGPYLNAKLCGMHPAGQCRAPVPEEYRAWFATGVVRRMTAALELPGSDDLLADAIAAGVLISLGHTDCLAEDVRRWADLGLRHATHLYNAMSSADKRGGPVRICGCLEGVLVDDRVCAEVILDGHHVPEYLFRIALRCKGAHGLALASDATPLTGAATESVPLHYGGETGGEMIVRNGRATSLDGKSLVGSISTLGEMLPRALAWTDGDWRGAARMLSTHAADLLNIGDRKGRIAKGHDADLVLANAEGALQQMWAKGRPVTPMPV